jgi:hypothetical protein
MPVQISGAVSHQCGIAATTQWQRQGVQAIYDGQNAISNA